MPRQPILSVLGHIDAGKCVSPDTSIQMADGGNIDAQNIFQMYKDEGERRNDKECEVYELDSGPKIFGISEKGEVMKTEVKAIWRLQKDELMEFRLSDGSNIEITPEHPFLVWENGELKYKEAEKLDQSQMVAIPEKIPVEDKTFEELKQRTLEKLGQDKRMIAYVSEELSDKLALKGRDIERDLLTNHLSSCKTNRRFRLIDLIKICESSSIKISEVYEEIEAVKQASTKFRAGKTSNKIQLPSKFSEFEDLAYASGMMLGDGNREANKLYNNNSALKKEFTRAIENSVGVKTQLKQYSDKVDHIYMSGGKTLSVFFGHLFEFPSKKKSHSIKISNYALELPRNVLANLISGYLDADGHVNKKGAVEVTSASKEMINSLKTALKQFGISPYIKDEGEYHSLFISGQNNLKNFSQIGFRHPEKRQRFQEKLENSKKDPLTGSTPVSGEYIKETRLQLGASHTEIDLSYQKTYEGYSNVSKRYISQLCGNLRELEQKQSFRENKKERKTILYSLKKGDKTRSKIYDEEQIDHRRLLNHILSLKSENLVRKDDNILSITEEGEQKLESWENNAREKLQSLEKLAESDLRFVKIESVERKEGGTVYDFTTELSTFIAEDIVVHNTTLLDNIRESRIVQGEAGGITQMIGATEVPMETLENVCGDLLQQLDTELTIPGVLFIDTPGHAAFSSLRKRGGSISDIAVVVIDIEDGVQPQTEEAIRILKQNETPFVIALNKVDKMHGWRNHGQSFMKSIQKQSDKVKEDLDNEIFELMAEINEFDLVVDRFDRVDNFRDKIAVVPISAKTGEGIPELLMVIAGLSQRYLSDQLEVEEGTGRGTVLEVSQEEGMGTTIDVIHYDGTIKKEDLLVYGTANGVNVTEIRALLEPRPLQEIRLDKKYDQVDRTEPASGVKIVGKNMEGVVAGAPIRTTDEEHLEEAKQEVENELQAVDFETLNEGVVVKADSLGSLEAIMAELEKSEIPVKKAEVGDVTKVDAIDVQNEDPENRVILAFNVGMTDQGKESVQGKGLEVFEGQVIYEILDSYEEWKTDLQQKQREKALEAVVRPAKIRLLEEHVFRSSNPAVVGVKVVEGTLKPDSILMDQNGERVGRVKSVQEQNESLDKAEKGSQVAASISNATVGRDFEEGDVLYTSITGKQYRQIQELDDLISRDEKNVLDKIVEIQDQVDPKWKIG